jgi:simple sugar transport system ATP-binding protein
VADHITVLRNGHVAGSTTPAESNRQSLAEMMVGRAVILTVDKDLAHPQETVLVVENLRACDDRERCGPARC